MEADVCVTSRESVTDILNKRSAWKEQLLYSKLVKVLPVVITQTFVVEQTLLPIRLLSRGILLASLHWQSYHTTYL